VAQPREPRGREDRDETDERSERDVRARRDELARVRTDLPARAGRQRAEEDRERDREQRAARDVLEEHRRLALQEEARTEEEVRGVQEEAREGAEDALPSLCVRHHGAVLFPRGRQGQHHHDRAERAERNSTMPVQSITLLCLCSFIARPLASGLVLHAVLRRRRSGRAVHLFPLIECDHDLAHLAAAVRPTMPRSVMMSMSRDARV